VLKKLIQAAVAGLLYLPPAMAAPCGVGDVGDIDTSCGGLWRERNRVYAENGYCFKTPRAIRAFGRGCFPPYGRLSHDDYCYVRALARMERAKGCAAD
jgi:hypothetical protein